MEQKVQYENKNSVDYSTSSSCDKEHLFSKMCGRSEERVELRTNSLSWF